MLHKLLKKSDHEIHIFANTLIIFIGVILFFGVIFLVLKHYALKSSMYFFINQARIESAQRLSGVNAVKGAQMLAVTVATAPSDKPLFTNKVELQKYITTLSQKTGRDIVVVDKNDMILADTIASNAGKKYVEDKSDEVTRTMQDGEVRSFTEKGIDYPQGIDQVVVPVQDINNRTEGAVIFSVYPVAPATVSF